MCILWCLTKLAIWAKYMSHSLHGKTFPRCVLWWLIKFPFWAKDLEHCLHWYVFSPVCVVLYLSRWHLVLKHFPQWGQGQGFSSTRGFSCLTLFPFWEIELSQQLFWYGFSPVCDLSFWERWNFFVNGLWQY